MFLFLKSLTLYCKFGNFRENYIFPNSVQRHICNAKYSLLEHDLTVSVNNCDHAISQGFDFHETLHISFVKIKLSRKFPNLQ